jgi:hypothetical protein
MLKSNKVIFYFIGIRFLLLGVGLVYIILSVPKRSKPRLQCLYSRCQKLLGIEITEGLVNLRLAIDPDSGPWNTVVDMKDPLKDWRTRIFPLTIVS